MKCLALLGLLLCSTMATAGEEQHLALALRFDALSNSADKADLADALLKEAIKTYPSFERHKEQLRLFMVETLESEEYKNEKARAYMRAFSEDELGQLVTMAQSPGYQILQRKRNAMTLALMLSTMNIMSKKLPEFQKSMGDDGKK